MIWRNLLNHFIRRVVKQERGSFITAASIIGGSIAVGTLGSAAISANASAAAGKTKTLTLHDPIKENLATPLSKYLQSQVGQGLPSYGGELVSPLPQDGGASVSKFLSMTPDQYNAPFINSFRNRFAADIAEPYAGRLSGSGAGSQANAAETNLQLGLAEMDMGLPEKQLQVAQQVANQQTAIDQADYQNWYTSLAQNNPALGYAMQFLSKNTDDGVTVLSNLMPTVSGLGGAAVGAAGDIAGALIKANSQNNLANAIAQQGTYGAGSEAGFAGSAGTAGGFSTSLEASPVFADALAA